MRYGIATPPYGGWITQAIVVYENSHTNVGERGRHRQASDAAMILLIIDDEMIVTEMGEDAVTPGYHIG